MKARISRTITLPDPLRVARCARAPELGPKILFFSGGSALKKTSRLLKAYTHHSIHIITPFDSGGSSAQLREAFGMFAVGDVRNRLLALADESALGNPEIYQLFSYRFPRDIEPEAAVRRLHAMGRGEDPLVEAVHAPLRQLVRTYLRTFVEHMPAGFDLRVASIGNLILAGGYLSYGRDIDSVLFLFSKLVEVRGHVRPVVDADLHLAAELMSGAVVVGQHRLTGKQDAPLSEPVRELRLVDDLDAARPAVVAADCEVLDLIGEADLICFPMGSFYSSVLANLLPTGVGRAIAAAECPKVYIPNTASDPEQIGLTAAREVELLARYVRRDAGDATPLDRVVDLMLVDTASGAYQRDLDLAAARDAGVVVLDLPLVTPSQHPRIDARKLVPVLVSLSA